MTYSIQVEAKDNVLTITGQTTEVPDGKYNINGHDAPGERQINVARFDGTTMLVQAMALAKTGP